LGSAGRLAAWPLSPQGPIEPALVVQVVQECGQELSGGRQPGIEVPLELFGRLLAIHLGDLVDYFVKIARPHLTTLLA
jgi:hypothetical protein